MTLNDLKLTIFNSLILALSFNSNLQDILKIVLLISTIGYTILKSYEIYINKIKKNGSNNTDKDKNITSED